MTRWWGFSQFTWTIITKIASQTFSPNLGVTKFIPSTKKKKSLLTPWRTFSPVKVVSTPLKSICQNGILPQMGGENNKYLKPPPGFGSSTTKPFWNKLLEVCTNCGLIGSLSNASIMGASCRGGMAAWAPTVLPSSRGCGLDLPAKCWETNYPKNHGISSAWWFGDPMTIAIHIQTPL